MTERHTQGRADLYSIAVYHLQLFAIIIRLYHVLKCLTVYACTYMTLQIVKVIAIE